MERICRLPTNTDSETEREEANSGHQHENNADEAHLFTPSTLLFRTADAFGLKKSLVERTAYVSLKEMN